MSDDECIQNQPVDADDWYGNMTRQVHSEVKSQLDAIRRQIYGP